MAEHNHHHSIVPGEVPVPHGPPSDSDVQGDYPVADASPEERRIFGHVTRPDDSYTPEGVYWADLPLAQRLKFTSKVDREAAGAELSTIGRMMKKDPLSPLSWYFRHAVIPGAGLGLEGYVLFSIGNLEPLFAQVWPECWDDNTTCSKNWVASVTYLEIIGIMVGQFIVGVSLYIPHCISASTDTAANIAVSRSSVTGSVAAGVSFRMPSSCLSVLSCSRPAGVSPSRAGSSATPGLSSSTVCPDDTSLSLLPN